MHTTSIMSAARAKAQAVPWALPLIGTMPLNRQYQILGALGGLCLVAAALFFFASIRETSNNAVYLTTATEMQMLSQRLAKGAQQAVLGNVSGFEQLQQGRDKFGADLNNLIYGSASVPAATKLAQADLDAISQLWAPMEQKASLILSQKTDLVNLGKNVLAINNNNPRLLELAQEVESTLATNNAPVRAVRVASRQVMLTQKLAKNANALLSGELVDPEVAFLLAKDTNTFRDNLLGLINGSEELLIAPTKDQESLDRIKDLQDAFKEFEGSVTSILQNQQKLIQAKQSGQSIFVGSEKVLDSLQKLTDRLQAEAEKQGMLIAAILSAVLMLIFLALMGFASVFDAGRRVLELKQADEALQKANDELEKRVQERTAELKAAHARINHILASSPAVLYSFEASGDYAPTFISENLRKVFGYEPSEYLEDRNFVPDRIHPDDAARIRGNLSHLFKEGYLTHEYRFRRKDGHYCWVSDELKVIHDDAGKPVEVIGSWSDISARKAAEEALAAAHARINHILASSPAVLFSFEASGDYAPTFISENLRTVLGYEPSEYLEDPNFVPDRIHPDDAARIGGDLSHLYKKGHLINEYRFRHKEGSYRWVSDELRVIYDDAGKPVEVIGSWSDITKRKLAEEELQLRTREIARSLEELKALGEVSQAVNSTLDLQTVLTSIVSHAVQLSGADAGTIYEYDEQSEGFIPRATYQMKEDLIKTLRANPVRLGEGGVGRAAVARAPIQIPDIEKQGAYESRLQSLMAQSGFRAILSVPLLREDRIFGGLAVLRESPGEFPPEVVKLLQTFAAQSVLAIQNARLFRQIEEKAGQLEMASKYKSQFVANMSHEIRTPMNAIIGMTHLALQTELTERQRNYLGKVDTAAKGLLGVINDILDFSKIEAGKLHTERVDFSLDSVLEQVADVSAFKAQDKGLELLFDVGTDIPMALIGDPMRLRQVLLNLISNATKFTEKGEITVGVHLIAAQDSMAHLRFDVKDSGIGLTTEQRARLFSAFAQADASTTRKYGGTGLGLSISKGLVEAMGGEIGVESEPGAGSTFYFTAKLGLQAQQRPVIPLTPHLQGMRVLVVDDNASAREIFVSMLHSLKFEPRAVPSGAAAIEALRQAQSEGNPYGLVLMDWRMPGMDGVEAIRLIQADTSLEKTPTFIMATAFSREELLQQAQGIAFEGLLAKPVSPSTLFDCIMTAFAQEVVQAPRKLEHRGDLRETAKLVHGAHLLLVEDNAVNQELAVELLSSAGASVDVANNGVEAIDKVKQTHYDAVLMDCQMPLMDGFEATRRIRTDARFRELPIIAMTASVMADDRARCINAGMNDHVAKPVDVNELFSTLVRWLKRSAGEAVVSAAEASQEDAHIRIPGVDVEKALKRVGGSIKIYKTLLSRFCETQTDAVQRIREAIGRADIETAQRESHTLKGLAGSVGATGLAECAKTAENLLKTKETTGLDQALASLEKSLSDFVASLPEDALETGSEREPQTTAQRSVDPAALGAALIDLAKLIARDDTRAAKAFEAISGNLRAAGQGERSKQLQNLIARYDFETAAAVLEKMAQELGVGLQG